jgi:hypothetical protein
VPWPLREELPDKPVRLWIMSTAEQWDFTVPENDEELLAELRRHGVRPGRRLHVSVEPDELGAERDETGAEATGRRRRLSFAGSIHAEPDLSERVDDYLKGLGKA